MTVHTICDTCGLEYVGAGVTIGQSIYCCAGCARGGPCVCGTPAALVVPAVPVTNTGGVVAGPNATVVSGGDAGTTVVTPGGDVVVVK